MPFNFPTIWEYTQRIQRANAEDVRLFGVDQGPATPRNASLTESSCTAFAGFSWSYYSGMDILNRLTTWKIPLITLVASFPRPPLGFWVEIFVVIHLLGDPVRTVSDLLNTISDCQSTAQYWKDEHSAILGPAVDLRTAKRDWKALAIIENAYAECGDELPARETLLSLRQCPSKHSLKQVVWNTANLLAADRATKSVIIIVLQCIFIASVGIAMLRTAAAADSSVSSDTVFINVEAHSIAFSAQYFWIISAVYLASIIGVSQTRAAIPNILRGLKNDLNDKYAISEETRQHLDALDQNLSKTEARIFGGGVPSWKPLARAAAIASSRWMPSKHAEDVEKSVCDRPSSNTRPIENLEIASASKIGQSKESGSRWSSRIKAPMLLPSFIVVLGTGAGMAVSALVPPDGFDCRHIAQLAILLVWLASAQVDSLLQRLFPITRTLKKNRGRLFWCTFAKDLIATSSTIGCVIATQLGILNRCSCYTRWGTTGLKLPQMPDVAAILRKRLGREYPLVTFAAIVAELLIIPLSVWLWYGDAMIVFVQRDDENYISNQASSQTGRKTLQKNRLSADWTYTLSWRNYKLADLMSLNIPGMRWGYLSKFWIYWPQKLVLKWGCKTKKGDVAEIEAAASL